ncbi:MAG: sacC [Verrucomicrobiales bacterium]|nr:sacC [Verrucomicrobiales bacterium]
MKHPFPLLAALLVSTTAAARPAHAAEDLILADFESAGYPEGWTATGTAFGSGPAQGALPGQMEVRGFIGRGLINTFHGGDDAKGTLTSAPFKIERPYLNFLIGGGKDAVRSAMFLKVDNKTVRSATGPNDRPGGSEALEPDSWDVREFLGRTATLEITDQATGGWGHLNVDHLVQSDRAAAPPMLQARRDFKLAQKFLLIPIKNGIPTRKVTLLIDGKKEVVNDIQLADAAPDWWALMDVSAWQGKTATLEVDRLPADSTALTTIRPADGPEGGPPLYREPLRGQFHFSPRRGWNNDPNGMVFFNNEYHLFFQHNPYGWDWGNMHWGHAVSPDMVHWQELGDKLAPDDSGPMFSGSAVVDWKNTSGFGKDGKPPLVLIYTAAGNPTVQSIAYSTDARTFTKYSGNPVIPEISNGNRDPKVFWHEPTQKWVMVLYVEMPGKQHSIHFFTSPNLREWKLASITKGGIDNDKYLFECPDFFPLPVDGNAADQPWVLLAADSQYAIGTFDGTTFHPTHSKLPGHRGRGFYAAQTFSDIPAADGRRVLIGWFQTPTSGMPFNQSMSVPLELGLTKTPDGPRLTFNPARELSGLRAKSNPLKNLTVTPDAPNPLAFSVSELVELRAVLTPGDAETVTFDIRGATLTYSPKKQEISINDIHAPAPLRNGRLDLAILCDRTGLEIFAAGGLTYIPLPFQPKPDNLSLGLKVSGAPVLFDSLEIHELRSAWK